MSNLSRVAGGDFSSDYSSVGPCPYYAPPSGGSFPLPVKSNCSNGLQPETWDLTDYSPSTECSRNTSNWNWDSELWWPSVIVMILKNDSSESAKRQDRRYEHVRLAS